MLNLILGGLTVAGLFLLINYTQKQEIKVNMWQWILTGLGLLFALFTVEVIAGFLVEAEPRAAAVVGLVLVILTIIWGVLLARFVFAKKTA